MKIKCQNSSLNFSVSNSVVISDSPTGSMANTSVFNTNNMVYAASGWKLYYYLLTDDATINYTTSSHKDAVVGVCDTQPVSNTVITVKTRVSANVAETDSFTATSGQYVVWTDFPSVSYTDAIITATPTE